MILIRVLFFIHLETRRVCLAGITPYPDQQWIEQQARCVFFKIADGYGGHNLFAASDGDRL